MMQELQEPDAPSQDDGIDSLLLTTRQGLDALERELTAAPPPSAGAAYSQRKGEGR
jgi:hypothetical protein